MSEALVSVVIRARDEAADLQQCIDALREQSRAPDEIILVYDDRSRDDTLAIARRNGLVVLEIEGERFSFGRALNLGCGAARGDFVVLVSAHALPVDRNWLAELIRPLEHDGNLAGTFSRQLVRPDRGAHLGPLMTRAYPERPERCRVVFSNASAAIRREIWRAELFAESLVAAEDLEWALRVRRRGHEIAYCPRSLIRHSHDESFRQVMRRTARCETAALEIGHRRPSWRHLARRAGITIGLIALDAWALGLVPRHLRKLVSHRLAMLMGIATSHLRPLVRSERKTLTSGEAL